MKNSIIMIDTIGSWWRATFPIENSHEFCDYTHRTILKIKRSKDEKLHYKK